MYPRKVIFNKGTTLFLKLGPWSSSSRLSSPLPSFNYYYILDYTRQGSYLNWSIASPNVISNLLGILGLCSQFSDLIKSTGLSPKPSELGLNHNFPHVAVFTSNRATLITFASDVQIWGSIYGSRTTWLDNSICSKIFGFWHHLTLEKWAARCFIFLKFRILPQGNTYLSQLIFNCLRNGKPTKF